MADVKVTWITAKYPPEAKLADWERSIGVTDDGTIYVPGRVAGNPDVIFLCAAFDGVPLLRDEHGHIYFPAPWIEQEYPDTSDVLRLMEQRARECMASASG